tara:strand:- start:343 stop:558 length:216 start_codon:yes stop_codon:yes gene_type:complete
LKQIARRKENFPTLKGGEGTKMYFDDNDNMILWSDYEFTLNLYRELDALYKNKDKHAKMSIEEFKTILMDR